jgi:radical SAM protein with 4Fe4S-binding SPASM domain
MSRKGTLRLSVSIRALRQKFGAGYLDAAKPVLDVIRHNGGDVHFVIDDPDEPGIFEEIKYLFEYPVPVVRISTARHWDRIKDKNESYKALLKRVADYVYFEGQPKWGRCQWDSVFKHNIYRRLKGEAIRNVPPTFCGCGYFYLAVNNRGEIFPCDFFANFPEFKIGDVFNGFNETSLFFRKMGEWIDGLYEDCRGCEVCEGGDIRLCPRAMCLAENYIKTGNPLKPAVNHCWANRVEYFIFDYIAKRAIELGIK